MHSYNNHFKVHTRHYNSMAMLLYCIAIKNSPRGYYILILEFKTFLSLYLSIM